MADSRHAAELLNELIEGRMAASPYAGDAAALAVLARRCRQVQLPGPSPAQHSRLIQLPYAINDPAFADALPLLVFG